MASNQPQSDPTQEGTDVLATIQETEPAQAHITREERTPAPAISLSDAQPSSFTLHRAGTLPAHRPVHEEGSPFDGNRRRGRTVSSRRDTQLQEPSPRSQIFKKPSLNKDVRNGENSTVPNSQSGQPEPTMSRPRSSTNSERPRFSSSGLRPRKYTTTSIAGARARGSTFNRRPPVLVAVRGATIGKDVDTESANFTLAGTTPVEVVPANQPYVDPGYTDLNPAYDQPTNSRPLWGLAKPLPRILRPGMVPTKSELQMQITEQQQTQQDPTNVDLEEGRVEPTLNLGKVSSQLQNTRAQREIRLVQTFSRIGQPPVSPLERRPTFQQALSPSSQVIIEDEQNAGSAKLEAGDQTHETPQAYFPDDTSSATTEKDQEEDLDGDWIGEEIPLKTYDPENDEIHNLHTHWSVIRLRFREPLAELLAVTVQLTLGFCSDLVVVTSSSTAGNETTTDWAWGLATMIGIYIAGGISGAHLNPAISIMLWIFRGFPLRKVPIYVFAQLLGAFLAALIAYGLYQDGIIAYGGMDLANSGTEAAFITYPRHAYVGKSTAFFTEFTGTAILAVAVLALGDDTNAPPGAGMNAFILGLIITVLSMAFGYNTGIAMNGARDLGPRLALLAVGYRGVFDDSGYWIYGPWVGSITGAGFGAFLYDVAIFVGGESPINYPRKRIKRAEKKWRRKWVGRLKGAARRAERVGR